MEPEGQVLRSTRPSVSRAEEPRDDPTPVPRPPAAHLSLRAPTAAAGREGEGRLFHGRYRVIRSLKKAQGVETLLANALDGIPA